MKLREAIIFAVITIATAGVGAPFVTPDMMKRNGLTDEQYELLWSQGKNPRIDTGAARQWVYRSSRYDNVTNWLGIIGRTNNFAALAAKVPWLTDENYRLSNTNTFLVKSRDEWRTLAESWYTTATNRQARHDRIVTWATEQRDKAKLPTTKAIWQLLIDRLNKDESDDGRAD